MISNKIILAEDDTMLASLLEYRLTKAGYDVSLLADGKAVKEQLAQELPSAIICDIMMPYFSGIELVDYLRNELKSQIPIILISAASNEENVLNAFRLGANDFLSKPVSPSELLIRVSKEIDRYYCN